MSEYPRPTGATSSDELDLVSLFHRLRRASAAGTRALSPREERLLEMIRELFEPRTVAEARPHGKPVRPLVNRAATVAARGHLLGGSAVVLGLRRVELFTPEPLRIGEAVAVSIASVDRRSWFAFHGRVVRCRRGGRTATVALLPGPEPSP